MCGLGTLKIIIAVTLPFAMWAWFISVGSLGAKIIAFPLQYVIFRTIVRPELRAAAAEVPLSCRVRHAARWRCTLAAKG
jgi:intracellular septation protein